MVAHRRTAHTYIHNHLSAGGIFLNYDVVTPPSQRLEKSYMSMWRQGIKEHPGTEKRRELMGIPEESVRRISEIYIWITDQVYGPG